MPLCFSSYPQPHPPPIICCADPSLSILSFLPPTHMLSSWIRPSDVFPLHFILISPLGIHKGTESMDLFFSIVHTDANHLSVIPPSAHSLAKPFAQSWSHFLLHLLPLSLQPNIIPSDIFLILSIYFFIVPFYSPLFILFPIMMLYLGRATRANS